MQLASNIILIGGSAGSYTLIAELLEQLPSYFDTAICIVLHRNRQYDTQIEKSLSRKLKKNIVSAFDKLDICKNHVYFAPAGYHLLIEPDFTFSIDSSEHINYSRPSIDVLFETAAQIYKEKCTAFLLSGANTDGAKGLRIIEEFGGRIIIQDPEVAPIRTMPLAGKRETLNPEIWTDSKIVSYFNTLN
ncbi:chemotaxis protein CheB [Sphingobacterium bovistauri]|uniref:protein-glutamate methylesterase n=1 Tax=Sphingobacterium bovistauri TaxID=2781959 RepID=A0ABS7Z9D1_9SPHI|nr:chemotaxis protein CheB [Sphingobacterium bovistauri]MCA5006803.1 chemotaxis protein CheB [Sphingobacterium bovistauri]